MTREYQIHHFRPSYAWMYQFFPHYPRFFPILRSTDTKIANIEGCLYCDLWWYSTNSYLIVVWSYFLSKHFNLESVLVCLLLINEFMQSWINFTFFFLFHFLFSEIWKMYELSLRYFLFSRQTIFLFFVRFSFVCWLS